MKIIVLHGDYTQKSYGRLAQFRSEAKRRGWDVKPIDKKDKLSLSEQLASRSLFDTKALYIVDDFNSIQKAESSWLKEKSDEIDVTLVIYHNKLLTQTALKSMPKLHKIEEFKLPKLIWNFLDSFYPSNAKNCMKLLHQIIENEPVEFVFALLARHLRDLYWVTLEDAEFAMPPWRADKLKRQADKYKAGQIKKIIGLFAKADVISKTSKANLVDELDFIIATKL